MSSPKCPNCDAKVSAAEMSDGWCEACGKRLPSSSGGGRGAGSRAPHKQKWPGTKKITFGGIVVLTVCVAIGIGIGNIAMKGPIGTAIGAGIGSAVGVLIGRLFGMMPTPASD